MANWYGDHDMRDICANCGWTVGAHHSDSSSGDGGSCPGPSGRLTSDVGGGKAPYGKFKSDIDPDPKPIQKDQVAPAPVKSEKESAPTLTPEFWATYTGLPKSEFMKR